MRRDRLPAIAIITAFILALGAVAAVVWVLAVRISSAPPPTVALRLGDDWDAIRAHSTYSFQDYRSHLNGYSIDAQPITLTFNDPAHPLNLSARQGLNILFKEGHVSQLVISPYGDQQVWQANAKAVERLAATLESAGWVREHPEQDATALLAGARAYYDNPTFKNMMNQYALGSWFSGDTRFEISLYRQQFTDELTTPQKFSIYLNIEPRQ